MEIPARKCYQSAMTDLERNIHSALVELETSVAAMRTASSKPDLMPIFTRIEELAQQLPSSTPRDLLHYLQKKSYQKARLFLEGRNKENKRGSCGHV
jgi:hypothetical protein